MLQQTGILFYFISTFVLEQQHSFYCSISAKTARKWARHMLMIIAFACAT